jgi:hypothetical protein
MVVGVQKIDLFTSPLFVMLNSTVLVGVLLILAYFIQKRLSKRLGLIISPSRYVPSCIMGLIVFIGICFFKYPSIYAELCKDLEAVGEPLRCKVAIFGYWEVLAGMLLFILITTTPLWEKLKVKIFGDGKENRD